MNISKYNKKRMTKRLELKRKKDLYNYLHGAHNLETWEYIKSHYSNEKKNEYKKNFSHAVFEELSTRRKKVQWKKIKKLIAENGYKGIIYTHHVTDPDDPTHSWLDFYFLSKKHKYGFYNATISSKILDLLDELDIKYYAMFGREPESISNNFEKFMKQEIEKEINFDSKDTTIHIDKCYAFGFGLIMKINEWSSRFTLDDVVKYVELFLENGEENLTIPNNRNLLLDSLLELTNSQFLVEGNKVFNKKLLALRAEILTSKGLTMPDPSTISYSLEDSKRILKMQKEAYHELEKNDLYVKEKEKNKTFNKKYLNYYKHETFVKSLDLSKPLNCLLTEFNQKIKQYLKEEMENFC